MKRSVIACVACVAIAVSCGGRRNSRLGAAIDQVAHAANEVVESAADRVTDKVVGAAESVGDRLREVAAQMHAFSRSDVSIEKKLLYDQHTLADTFPYKDGVRAFQFDKMRDRLFMLDSIGQGSVKWGILQNRRDKNGKAPNVKDFTTDEYHSVADRHGVQRRQSVPLYVVGELGREAPERYGRDGSLVKLLGYNADSTAWRLESYNAPGEWEVPLKYVKPIETTRFDKTVMVDLTNQIIATLEQTERGKWLVRSMNPCTTGAHQPPHAFPTPVGVFVIQDRTPKMMYDNGGPVIVGFAPWASRFTNGAFLHGWPVNDPNGAIVEFSQTLGTIPRSHECVRNASSHAKFIYDWAPLEKTLVFVYD